jgi:hypothetical protein
MSRLSDGWARDAGRESTGDAALDIHDTGPSEEPAGSLRR